MSIRIALEQHIKNKLDEVLSNSKYQVIESLRTKERPVPAVVIIAGDISPAFENSDLGGNYHVPLTIVALSSIDKTSINEHNDVIQLIINKMREYETRRISTVKNLTLYQINSQAIAQDNSDRKMGVQFNYECIINYAPDLNLS